MEISTVNGASSSSPRLLGTGKLLCVVCGVRAPFNNGRRSYPTCGLRCAGKLQDLLKVDVDVNRSQDDTKPLCVVCGVRPQFNNGRRAFPTCGNTCARNLQDMMIGPSSLIGQNSAKSSDKMCKMCKFRPRCERAGKIYPTCGLTCAAKLHARDRQILSDGPQNDAKQEEPEPAYTFLEPVSEASATEISQEPFDCIICLETLEGHHMAHFACEHTFCRSCLKGHITSELEQHHYPIICPSCKIGKRRFDKPVSAVDETMIQNLGLGTELLAIFYELQLSAHSIAIHCKKCKETMFVDRGDYQQIQVIECPLPLCNYLWCKNCQREVIHGRPRHSCDGSKELEHLIKKKGWRHCPGCKTPVQKSEGCNHMTCTAPGCNTHFCYHCGANIIKSLLSGDIREATKTHYESCKLF